MHRGTTPPATRTPLTEEDAEAHLHGICFKTGPPARVGVELEWLVHPLPAPGAALPPAARAAPLRLAAALAELRATPLDSALSLEPGGQLEFSSRPAPSLPDCVRAVSADLAAARATLQRHRLALAGHGIDPATRPRRLLHDRRYRAMEAYFDRTGPAGRAMMCSSASVQVCLDAGTEDPGPFGLARRWHLAHLLGAVLTASFANSPLLAGRRTGWRSTRQAVWAALDGHRTLAPPPAADPRTAWARWVLDTPVMCVRPESPESPESPGGDGPWHVPQGLTFREWIRTGHPRPPRPDDLAYHLTTLFPPVRAQGHLELRMIDAQPGRDGWIVPLAVTTALFDDAEAAERAHRAVKPLADLAGDRPAPRNPLWRRAAQHALADPDLHAAALACFAAAEDALPRLGAPDHVRRLVADFTDRYVRPGRCPADDLLDALPARAPRHEEDQP